MEPDEVLSMLNERALDEANRELRAKSMTAAAASTASVLREVS